MTGTSLDALDVAIVRVRGGGLAMRASFVRGVTRPLGEVAPALRALAAGEALSSGAIACVAREFALLHADAALEALAGERCDLACVHGQTVHHAPPASWQLFEPAPMAAALGAPVVCQLRQKDLALGGQGAPITPLADWILFAPALPAGVVVNLGGFANVTRWRPPGSEPVPGAMPDDLPIDGGDVCACNHVLDALARDHLRAPFDREGAAATAGRVDDSLAARLGEWLARQCHAGRSLGTGDELAGVIGACRGVDAGVALRSACEAIAHTIAVACDERPIVLAGGGARNRALVSAIRVHADSRVVLADDLGVPIEYREAACFGVLGALARDGVPITLSRVTGRRAHAPRHATDAPGPDGVWAFP